MASIRYTLWEASDALGRHRLALALVVVIVAAAIVYLYNPNLISIPIAFGSSAPSYMYCAGINATTHSPQTIMEYSRLSSSGMGKWTNVGNLPLNTTLVSCVANGGYLYCIEGHNKITSPASGNSIARAANYTSLDTYYAKISNTTLGWSATASYAGGSPSLCFASGSYIYCRSIDKHTTIPSAALPLPSPINPSTANTFSTPTSSPFQYWDYSALTPGGTGNWQSRPIILKLVRSSCAVSNSYVYCVGGYNFTTYSLNKTVIPSPLVYSAPIESNGIIGRFVAATSYPIGIFGESCVTSGSYIYCIAGYESPIVHSGTGVPVTISPVSSAYYASVSNGTIGAWKPTTDYPVNALGVHCVSSNGYVYCTGGFENTTDTGFVTSSYYAPLSGSGIGKWTKEAGSDLIGEGESCVAVQ